MFSSHGAIGAACVLLIAGGAAAQNSDTGKLDLSSGKKIFLAACVGCHGPDGKGQPDTTVGFDKPETFPDFSRCDQTTPELNVDWKATIHDGGHGRGFSPIMPSFAEALTSEQIDMVVGYLRGFCREEKWPRGELNLPRAFVTEKAFPENEAVITNSVNANGAAGFSHAIVYEHTLSARNQMEITVPFNFSKDSGRWLGGVGDMSLGWKRVLASSLKSGSIFSVQGEVSLPTGSREKGLGTGVTVFETFAAYGQLLPKDFFAQIQTGVELPTHTETAPRAYYWHSGVGKQLRQGMGLGRLWSPQVELIADRDLETGAKTNWDVLPQFQVTLNKRQHIKLAFGVRTPMNNREGRQTQVLFYFLWDWFDGGLLEGWK